MDIQHLRQEYSQRSLSESEALANPMDMCRLWLQEAVAVQALEPNAMTLATVSAEGQPSARVVLLKDLRSDGFVFYTNYTSRKGQEIEGCQQVATVFFWAELERQLRVEGRVERIPAAESDAYFEVRPANSKLGAWASPQSRVIPSREHLEQLMAGFEAEFAGKPVQRPPHWGGYLLRPARIEFWQGRPSRLHDRLVYNLLPTGEWQMRRLAP